MHRTILSLALLALSAPAHAAPNCSNPPTTLDTVACAAAQTKTWDDRLNKAYAALSAHIDPGQRAPLRAAQRLWVQYRDANCHFYGSAEGTIREIGAAQCQLDMTKARAQELEQAAQP